MVAGEAFAGPELSKGVGDEVGLLVNPAGEVLLPLRYRGVGIVRVAVGLGVRVNVMALVILADFHASLPPVVDALVGLAEVALAADHGVEEELAGEAVGVYHIHGALTFGYLGMGVAAEADAVVVKPFHAGQESGIFIGDEAGVECLVEVDAVAAVDDLLELTDGIVTGGQDVVVHEDQLAAALDGYFVHVHVGTDGAFLTRHDAPGTLVGTSSGKKTESGFLVHIGIDAVVGLQAVYLVGQLAVQVIAGAAADDLVGVVTGEVVRREVENLGHVDTVIVEERDCPIHLVAALAVIACYLGEGKIGVDCRSPFLFLGVSVYVNEADGHELLVVLLLVLLDEFLLAHVFKEINNQIKFGNYCCDCVVVLTEKDDNIILEHHIGQPFGGLGENFLLAQTVLF